MPPSPSPCSSQHAPAEVRPAPPSGHAHHDAPCHRGWAPHCSAEPCLLCPVLHLQPAAVHQPAAGPADDTLPVAGELHRLDGCSLSFAPDLHGYSEDVEIFSLCIYSCSWIFTLLTPPSARSWNHLDLGSLPTPNNTTKRHLLSGLLIGRQTDSSPSVGNTRNSHGRSVQTWLGLCGRACVVGLVCRS